MHTYIHTTYYGTGAVPDASKSKSKTPAAARAAKGGIKNGNKAFTPNAMPPTSGNCPTVDNIKRRMEQWRRIEEEAMRQQEEQEQQEEEQERQQKEQEQQAKLEQQQEERERQQDEQERQEQQEWQQDEQKWQQKEQERQREQGTIEEQDVESSEVRRLFVNSIVDIYSKQKKKKKTIGCLTTLINIIYWLYSDLTICD